MAFLERSLLIPVYTQLYYYRRYIDAKVSIPVVAGLIMVYTSILIFLVSSTITILMS